MTWTTEEENRIRRYWLNSLPAADRQLVEEQLILNGEYEEVVRLIEHELVEDYALGLLSPADCVLFEQHSLLTAEQQRQLRLTRQLINYAADVKKIEQQEQGDPVQAAIHVEPAMERRSLLAEKVANRWAQFFSRPIGQVVALATILFVVGSGAWWWLRSSEMPATEVAEAREVIKRAFREHRVIESRLSDAEYAQFRRLMGAEPNESSSLELDQAANNLRLVIARQPSAAAHHALGQIYLGQRKFEQAREQFEAALKFGIGKDLNATLHQAQLHNDLGVALLELWNLEQSAGGGLQAEGLKQQSLEQFTQASALDPHLLAAQFNRAQLYQRAEQGDQARIEWRKYLDADSSSPWAKEAEEYLNHRK